MYARTHDATIRYLDFSARLLRATLLLLLLVLTPPAWCTTYYVATNGNDVNSGTSITLPLRTIQRAMNLVVPGDTVLIRGGTYREQVEAIRGGTVDKPIKVFSYAGEIPVIKGSDVVTGWVSDGTGGVWKKTGWPHNSQQVFVDFNAKPKKSLQQIGMPSSYYASWEYPTPVGSGRSTMTPGSFYYDPVADTLYVRLADGSDPNRRVMEVSVRRR